MKTLVSLPKQLEPMLRYTRDIPFRRLALAVLTLGISILMPLAVPILYAGVYWLTLTTSQDVRRFSTYAIVVAAAGVILSLSVGDMAVAEWLCVRCVMLALGMGLFAVLTNAKARQAAWVTRIWKTIDHRTSAGCSIVLALGILTWSITFARSIVQGSVFGDPVALLPFLRLGADYALRAPAALTLADGVAGAFVIFLLVRKRGTIAALFSAVAWISATGRLSPQFMGFQPTFVVPLAVLFWNRYFERHVLAMCVFSIAVGVLAPQMAVPAFVALLSCAISSGRLDRKNVLAASMGIAVALVSPIHLIPFTRIIVGDAIDPILLLDGGDGTYPWEWLLPGATSFMAPLTFAFTHASHHYGNAYEQSAGAGWVVLALALYALYKSGVRTWVARFCMVSIILSVIAVLPSHFGSAPLPVPSFLLRAPAVLFGVAGTLGLVLIAAVEFERQLRSAVAWRRALAAVCALALALAATPAPELFINPVQTTAYDALGRVPGLCESIAVAPSIEKNDFINRRLKLSLFAYYGARISQVRSLNVKNSEHSSATAPCLLIDYQAEQSYLGGYAAPWLLLPNSTEVASDRSASVTNPWIAGCTIQYASGSTFLYYCDNQ